ncbi:MAG: teicoplanin resistance protein VanZ [Sphingomonas fennica]
MAPRPAPRRHRRLPFVLAAALAAAAFAYAMAIVPAEDALRVSASDRVEHFLAFFTVAILFRLGLPRVRARTVLIGLAAFGAAIEVSQLLMPFERTPSLIDLAMDILATATGLAMTEPLVRRWRRRRA